MDNLYKFEELTPREQVMVGQAIGWDGTSYNAPDGVKITAHGEGEVAQYEVFYPTGIERSAESVNTATEPTPELPTDAATENLPVPEPTEANQQDVPSTDNGVGTSAPTGDGQAPTNNENGEGTEGGDGLPPATSENAPQVA